MSESVWDDNRIGDTVRMHAQYKVADIPCVSAATAHSLMSEIRDDMQERIDELGMYKVQDMEMTGEIERLSEENSQLRALLPDVGLWWAIFQAAIALAGNGTYSKEAQEIGEWLDELNRKRENIWDT